MKPDVAYLIVVVMAVTLLGSLGWRAWPQRHQPAGAPFVVFVVGATVWSALVGAMALASPAAARTILFLKYLAIGITTVATYLFVAVYLGHRPRVTPGMWGRFLLVPVIGWLAAWRDGWGMIRDVTFTTAHGLTAPSAIRFGPLYWVSTGYLYALLLVAIGRLLVAGRDGGILTRAQALPVLVSLVLPFACNMLLLTGVTPPEFDPMPLGMAVAGTALWWGTLGRKLLTLVPMARGVLVDSLRDGILIVDTARRILDINEAAARLLGREPRDLIGLEARPPLLPVWADAQLNTPSDGAGPTVPHGDRHFDLRRIDVRVPGDGVGAHILVLHDATERQQLEDGQARLITDLQAALAQVKTLSGLLPICAGCKRIRDASETWQPLEEYVSSRTHAEFSHGMCPTCMATWYPEHPDLH
ncbi:MAG: PAS domain-containing protein [Gemmatimonadetes bacterium]|nr:PAS domain-containing protein [Gemmatimonadota bacterium]